MIINRLTAALLLAMCPLLTACTGPQMLRPDAVTAPNAPLRLIATFSGTDEFTASLTAELSNRGYGVLNQARTSVLLTRLGLNPTYVTTNPPVLAALKARNVDAVLKIVATTTQGGYGVFSSVRATVVSTDEGLLLASLDWTNGSGGMPGSTLDNASRLKPAQAARVIADELARQLGAPGAKDTASMDDLIAENHQAIEQTSKKYLGIVVLQCRLKSVYLVTRHILACNHVSFPELHIEILILDEMSYSPLRVPLVHK